MRLFKFKIPAGDERPCRSNPQVMISGCAAVVAAESREKAIEMLAFAIASDGPHSHQWADIADVTEIDPEFGGVILRVQS